MLGDAHPLATPELRPKVLTRACPDDFDLFSIEELTPEKRGSPKVNTALPQCNLGVVTEEHAL
jgi:hypothetical protein